MSPSVSKDAILDAAEAIVCESGAAHMTLDGVAERAQVSKGGLMYSFPSKSALLQAMIGRLIDNIEALRGQIRQENREENPSELLIEIRVLATIDEQGSRPMAAVLAAIANEPDLMEPFREGMKQRFADRVLHSKNRERSTILFFAALGLHFANLLHIPLLEPEQRTKVYADLIRLAGSEKEKV